MEKALFFHSFSNLEYGKGSYCIGKVWKKFCSLDPKICTNPVLAQPVVYFSDWWYCKILVKYFVMWEEVSQLTNASVYHGTVILLATFCPYFVLYSEFERSNELLWRSKDRFFFIKFSLSLLFCQATYMKTVTIHICNLKVHTESWNLPSNFPDLEKILVKSWECFFESYKRNFFFVLAKSYSISFVGLQRIMENAFFSFIF